MVLAASDQDPEGPVKPCRVVETYRHDPRSLVEVRIDQETIISTPKHPFYVKGKGWTAAENLAHGDSLQTHDKTGLKIHSVTPLVEESPVFNLHVESNHTYFVQVQRGKAVLVHNDSGADDSRDWGVTGWGFAKMLGGTLQIVGGVVGAIISEDTYVGPLVGGAVVIDGADTFAEGLNEAWHGVDYNSAIAQGAQATAEAVGVDQRTAERFGENTKLALGVGGAIATGGLSSPGTGAGLAVAGGGVSVVIDATEASRAAAALAGSGAATGAISDLGTKMSQQGGGASNADDEAFKKLQAAFKNLLQDQKDLLKSLGSEVEGIKNAPTEVPKGLTAESIRIYRDVINANLKRHPVKAEEIVRLRNEVLDSWLSQLQNKLGD
jgi:hypothetical protein